MVLSFVAFTYVLLEMKVRFSNGWRSARLLSSRILVNTLGGATQISGGVTGFGIDKDFEACSLQIILIATYFKLFWFCKINE